MFNTINNPNFDRLDYSVFFICEEFLKTRFLVAIYLSSMIA